MIELRGRATDVRIRKPLVRSVFRLDEEAETNTFRLTPHDPPRGFIAPKLKFGAIVPSDPGDWVSAPLSMAYLKTGDVISLSTDGKVINALWRGNNATNTLLLTERCDNLCLMCSQPPRDRVDDWLLGQAFEAISLMPENAFELGISGGEPTLYGDRFIELVNHVRVKLPDTFLHILSNGRKFADPKFAAAYANATSAGTMVGIPLYGAECGLHDYVVQAEGAFEETINGIINLAELGEAIEIRVVLHAATAPHIVSIAQFIARNLPFVDQVALMGLEMMGLARRNIDLLWIEPLAYQESLAEAVETLHAHGIHTMIYNHQLCLLHRDIWQFAVKSISDWKNEYDPLCAECAVVDRCGGFFHSAKYGSSSLITPLKDNGEPKHRVKRSSDEDAPKSNWSRRMIPVTPVEW